MGIVFCIILAFAIVFGFETSYYNQGDYLKYFNLLDELHQYNKIGNVFVYPNHYNSALTGVITLAVICFLIFLTPIVMLLVSKIKKQKINKS
ncbi:MAG: hypothetical protein E7G84_02505 [Ureaplasma urealyticum]|nr:hypothetical protein [Ureaplasma urealyticum]